MDSGNEVIWVNFTGEWSCGTWGMTLGLLPLPSHSERPSDYDTGRKNLMPPPQLYEIPRHEIKAQ